MKRNLLVILLFSDHDPAGAADIAPPKIKSLGHRYDDSLYLPDLIPIGRSFAKFAAS